MQIFLQPKHIWKVTFFFLLNWKQFKSKCKKKQTDFFVVVVNQLILNCYLDEANQWVFSSCNLPKNTTNKHKNNLKDMWNLSSQEYLEAVYSSNYINYCNCQGDYNKYVALQCE